MTINTVPVQCEVIGELYTSDDHRALSQDMLEIVLPSGILISAGWYPDSDPHGRYVVMASLGMRRLEAYETRDVDEAGRLVELALRTYFVPADEIQED